jgi:hypothetical protein
MFEGSFREGKEQSATLEEMDNVVTPRSVQIKAIILANSGPANWKWENGRAPDTNTLNLTSEHIASAVALPEGHPVRTMLAMAAVEGYLRQPDSQFENDTSRFPEFAADLLKAVRATITSLDAKHEDITFEEPISRERLRLKKA